MTHHDPALFQKAGTTSLRTGSLSLSLSFILALGHLQRFLLPDYLLPQTGTGNTPTILDPAPLVLLESKEIQTHTDTHTDVDLSTGRRS